MKRSDNVILLLAVTNLKFTDLLIHYPFISHHSTVKQFPVSLIIVFTEPSWFFVKEIWKIPHIVIHGETKVQEA